MFYLATKIVIYLLHIIRKYITVIIDVHSA